MREQNNETWIHSLSVSPEEIAWEAFQAGFGYAMLYHRDDFSDSDIAFFFESWRKTTRIEMDDSKMRKSGVPKPL